MEHSGGTEIEFGMGEYGKSRSQMKRESAWCQDLGGELAALPPSVLEDFGLPGDVLAAMLEWQGMTKHEARRRQMQFIGRLVRELGEVEREAVAARLEAEKKQRLASVRSFSRLESLRDRLVVFGTREATLVELKQAYPALEEKKLRHLAEAAEAEKARGKTAKFCRELFRFLKGLG